MLANLVGIFEATRDINTALDECCLQQQPNRNGEDDQLFDGDFSLMRKQLEEMIAEQNQDMPIPESTIAKAIELAQRLTTLGDNAQHLELEAQQRIHTWTKHGVKAKETKLSKLEEMRLAVTNFFTAKQLLTEVSDLSAPIETRVDHFLQFVQITPVRPNTQFALWQKLQVDFYLLKLKLQLQDHAVQAMKKTTSSMFQSKMHDDALLIRCRDLVSLCVRFQLLVTPPQTNDVFNGEIIGQLWGVTQVFAKPVLVRFQYHFCSEKSQTNRVDRPEWFVGFVVESVRDRALFIEQEIQPRCSTSDKGGVVVDVLSHFIRCLVMTSHNRLESSWPVLRLDHALLSHTIDEILVGDRALRQEFGYCIQQHAHYWPMLCDFFQGERLEYWIQADLQFARNRMILELLSAPMAWEASSSTEYSGCAGSIVSLVRMLGDRAGMLTNKQSRQLYANNVQVEILREFVGLAVGRRDVSQRFNALFPLQELLRDWKLEYGEDFPFDPVLTLVQDTLQEELETEASGLFYDVTRTLREWERKRWNLSSSQQQDLSVSSPEIRLALERCGSLWKQRVNSVCRARLLRVFATRLEDYLVEFCLRRQFSAHGIEQFHVDVTQFYHLFDDSLVYFAKLRVLVHLLSKYTSKELEDKSVWYSDLDENRSHFDALGLAPHKLAKLKL